MPAREEYCQQEFKEHHGVGRNKQPVLLIIIEIIAGGSETNCNNATGGCQWAGPWKGSGELDLRRTMLGPASQPFIAHEFTHPINVQIPPAPWQNISVLLPLGASSVWFVSSWSLLTPNDAKDIIDRDDPMQRSL
jgi:hypothetical protein